ncbi:MAG: hypothetical protein QXT63_02880 [Thermoplasmata archaeon]
MNKEENTNKKEHVNESKKEDRKENGTKGKEEKEEKLCRKEYSVLQDFKYSLLQPISSILGLVVAILVLFLFPFQGVSTLMHQVLHFPGPGAGIAFPIGMVLIAFMLASYALTRYETAPFWTALVFGIVYNLLAPYAGGIPFAPIINRLSAAILFGLGVSFILILLKDKKLEVKYFLTGALGDLLYLVLFWILVFPFSPKGWVKPGAVPILAILAICAGLAGALFPYLYARSKKKVI